MELVPLNAQSSEEYLGGIGNVNWQRPFLNGELNLIVAVSDFTCAVFSSLITGILYHQIAFGRPGNLLEFAALGTVMASVFVPLMQNRGAYQNSNLISVSKQITPIVMLWWAVLLFMICVGFALKVSADFSRGTILLLAIVGPAALLCERYFLARYITYAAQHGKLRRRRVLVIAEDTSIERVTQLLHRSGRSPYRFLTVASSDQGLNEAVDLALDIVRGSNIEEIHIAVSWSRWPAVKAMLWKFYARPLPLFFLPDGTVADVLTHPQVTLGDAFAFELLREPLSIRERVLKRAMDIVVSSLGLLVLCPVMLIAAVLIRLDSPGPILFRQVRKGINGQPFRILKFRTMSVMEDGAVVAQTTRQDPRVTRTGHWLRRASIDELPQLLNVLLGEMSIVGPRPHALAHDNEYTNLIANYSRRHHVKPGITGWAQANGFRGGTPELAMMQRRVELDLRYIANWSLVLDVWIIVRTCFELLRARNAF
jgi:Undecaprenyl-phosphate glucose phosphotransferase